MNKYELHVHTAECDLAAEMKAKDIVRKYYDAGYAGLVVTDHYFSIFDMWFADELKGLDKKQRMQRWLRGYYEAREEGEKLGFTVLPGAEVRFDGGLNFTTRSDSKIEVQGAVNDYLVYGLDEKFLLEAPPLNHCQNVEALIKLLPKDACVVWAHPFRYKMTVIDPSPLFGLEGFNGGNSQFQNSLAKLYAEHYGKPLTSGSDYHGRNRFASGGIETERLIKTPADLISVLRSGEYSLIENALKK